MDQHALIGNPHDVEERYFIKRLLAKLNIHEVKLQERSHEEPSSCGIVLIHNVMGENYACNTLGGRNILQQ